MSERPRFVVLGNPDNRRVTGFVEAARSRGCPEPVVVAWRELARDPEALLRAAPNERLVLRLESAGEDAALERAMLTLGLDAARAEGVSTHEPESPVAHGQFVAPRQLHLGFLALLDRVDATLAERPAWRALSPTDAVRELFDKRRTSRRYRAMGVPVPTPLDADDPTSLREVMRSGGHKSVWIKLASGSSASGLAVLQRFEEREVLMTTLELADDGWFNSLRVHRVDEPSQIDAIVGMLFREGAQVEAHVPKARLGARFFDLRVVVVAGEPAFTVVRTSAHPITNLHLGGSRGDVDQARRAVGDDAWEAAMRSCARVAEAHGTLHLGVDVGFVVGGGHVVFEANAFGDLLPGITRDGLSVYEHEIEAVARS